MYYVYVIQNLPKTKTYTGQTADLEKRLNRHNGILKTKKKSYTTKNKSIWKYVYLERFETRQQAIKREKELKSGKGREYLSEILKSRAGSSAG